MPAQWSSIRVARQPRVHLTPRAEPDGDHPPWQAGAQRRHLRVKVSQLCPNLPGKVLDCPIREPAPDGSSPRTRSQSHPVQHRFDFSFSTCALGPIDDPFVSRTLGMQHAVICSR